MVMYKWTFIIIKSSFKIPNPKSTHVLTAVIYILQSKYPLAINFSPTHIYTHTVHFTCTYVHTHTFSHTLVTQNR